MSTSLETDLSSRKCSAEKGQLERCLEMMKSAKNDNEKMASLMLFTHLMKNNTSLTVDSTKVFEAIGPRFIVRLLNSKDVPDGCPAFMYKSLGLNILASFTENELLCHPLIISSLPLVTQIYSSHQHNEKASELCEDSLKILLYFSRTQSGCEHLLVTKCIPIICQIALENPDKDVLFDVLKGILLHIPQKIWDGSMCALTDLLEVFSKSFSEMQDLNKFALCEKLVIIIQSLCQSNTKVRKNETLWKAESTWKNDIREGVRDILQSRCKVNYKYIALQLASNTVELFGITWTLELDQKLLDLSNTKFWFLLLCLVKIELKLILESDNMCEIQEKSDTVVACYKILEHTIEFMTLEEHCGWSLSADVVLQMHAILVESFECIIQFLLHANTLVGNGQYQEKTCFREPIVIATFRVLCAWLSEETNSLTNQVLKLLPIILEWVKADFNAGEDDLPANLDGNFQNGLISYLLPPLCHLSADERFCSILIEREVHIILAKYFDQLWQQQLIEQQDYPSSLVTLCNVFLNFAVLHIELVKTNIIFHGILDTVMLSLPKIVHTNCVVLSAHFALIGLLFFRHQKLSNHTILSDMETNFFTSVIDFLKQALPKLSGEEQSKTITVSFLQEWENISELWFLSLQNLLACAKLNKLVKKALDSSGWIKETRVWLDNCEEDDHNTELNELKSALLPITNLH